MDLSLLPSEVSQDISDLAYFDIQLDAVNIADTAIKAEDFVLYTESVIFWEAATSGVERAFSWMLSELLPSGDFNTAEWLSIEGSIVQTYRLANLASEDASAFNWGAATYALGNFVVDLGVSIASGVAGRFRNAGNAVDSLGDADFWKQGLALGVLGVNLAVTVGVQIPLVIKDILDYALLEDDQVGTSASGDLLVSIGERLTDMRDAIFPVASSSAALASFYNEMSGMISSVTKMQEIEAILSGGNLSPASQSFLEHVISDERLQVYNNIAQLALSIADLFVPNTSPADAAIEALGNFADFAKDIYALWQNRQAQGEFAGIEVLYGLQDEMEDFQQLIADHLPFLVDDTPEDEGEPPGSEEPDPTDPVVPGPVDPAPAALPYLTISDVTDASVTEGNSPAENRLSFLVQVHGEMSQDISFSVSTFPGNTSNGVNDYAGYSNYPVTLSAEAGQTERLIHVDLNGDHLPERTESFEIELSSISGARTRYASDLVAVGLIKDDDAGALTMNVSAASSRAVEHENADYYKVITPDAGTMSIDLSAMPTEAEVFVYDYLGVEHGELLAYQHMSQGQSGRLELPHSANDLYFIAVRGVLTNPDGYQIQVSSPPSSVGEPPVAPPVELPDLDVSAVNLNGESVVDGGTSVQTFRPGDVIEMTAEVGNFGGGIVGLTSSAIGASNGLVISPSQTVTTGVLASGASTTLGARNIQLADDLAPGTYTIAVLADQNDRVTEANEDNNLHQVFIRVETPASSGEPTDPMSNGGYGVDIAIENVVLSHSSMEQGGNITVSYDVVNVGTASATRGEVTAKSKLGPDAVGSTREGENSFRALAPGERDSETITFDIGRGQNIAQHLLELEVSSGLGDTNLSNNLAVVNYTVLAPPPPSGISDLTITNFEVEDVSTSYRRLLAFDDTTLLRSGDRLGVNWDNVHLGQDILFEANGSVGFYLSTDATVTTDDLLLYSEELKRLWIGNTEDESATLDALPDDLAAGTYYLAAITDIFDETDETVEFNNVSRVIEVQVGGPRFPDLMVATAELAQASIPSGATVDLLVQIQNIGSFPAYNSRFQVWMSQDAIFGNHDDVMLDQLLISRIDPAEISSGQIAQIGADIGPGTYNIFVETNGDGGISNEADDSNNLLYVGPLTVEMPSLPVITGNGSGAVSEDAVLTASGTLTATQGDVDALFAPLHNIAGSFGLFSINQTGTWIYLLNNDLAQPLNLGDIVQESFAVQAVSASGQSAEHTVLIAVSGNNTDFIATAQADLLRGTINAEVIEGLDGADTLVGLGGADTLDGGAGPDRMEGGYGSDVYRVDHAADRVIESAGEGHNDRIESTISLTLNDLSSQIEDLTLLGTANLDGGGNARDNVIIANTGSNVLSGRLGNDTLYAMGGHDTLDGGVGADEMHGGFGGDFYRVNHSADLIIEHAGQGNDTVESTVSLALDHIGRHVENLQLAGTADLAGRGNARDNVITGNPGDNHLLGALGEDTLIGRGGADTLDGGMGADYMVGGYGADTYIVNDFGDTLVEHAGQGVDSVESTISLTLIDLSNQIENLTLQGSGNIDGGGNGRDNMILGNSGNNALSGRFGDDTLDGGTGNDMLRGGSGNDTFVFSDGFGADVITDFNANDAEQIDLSGLTNIISFYDLITNHLSEVGGNSVITDGANTLTLDGITNAQIGYGQDYAPSDFIF